MQCKVHALPTTLGMRVRGMTCMRFGNSLRSHLHAPAYRASAIWLIRCLGDKSKVVTQLGGRKILKYQLTDDPLDSSGVLCLFSADI